MTDEVMDGTKSIKGACEPAVDEGMKAPSGGDGRSDLEGSVGTYVADEFFVAFIWSGASREHDSNGVASVLGEEGEEAIRFNLELPVRLDHFRIAMSASRMQVPLAHQDGCRRLIPLLPP